MSLTLGSGPFAKPQRGALNFDLAGSAPAHVLFLHDVPARVRGILGGETVVDTRGARMLHETGLLPQWYLPLADVRQDLLEPSDHTSWCPFKGEASYFSLRVGDRYVENALWQYKNPLPEAPALSDLVGFYDDRIEEWYEEDERVLGHPRDPFHRVDTRRTSRHVVVSAGGQIVAESERPIALFETGLPVRYYLPLDDLREEFFEATPTTTVCPYKGEAVYRRLKVGDKTIEDAAWCYPHPLGEAHQIRGYLSFLHEDVTITVDGQPYVSG